MKFNSLKHEHLIQQTCLLIVLLLSFQTAPYAYGLVNQAESEVKQLEPGRSLEREIDARESHKYQLTLTAEQFVLTFL